jgi:hypothetical protein
MIVIAYVSAEEPPASLIAPLLEDMDLPIVVSAISLTEVVTRPARAGDAMRVYAVATALAALPRLHIIDFDRQHALEAAFVRGQTDLRPISNSPIPPSSRPHAWQTPLPSSATIANGAISPSASHTTKWTTSWRYRERRER